WFAEVYPEVSAQNLGESFNALLTLLGELESVYLWEKTPAGVKASWNAKNVGRPSQLGMWVKGAQGSAGHGIGMANGVGPPIPSLAVYGKEWWRWWAKVQPTWRVSDTGRPQRFLRDGYPDAVGAWTTMRHPGPNGALSFVATLYWWGKKVVEGGEREDRESWADAVQDVKWMLTGLLTV
ncbi:hypothetical protein B0H13DRAFT_1529083, partial [Mycena leptocephala]